MDNLYGWDFPPQDLLKNYVNKCKLFVENDEAFFNFRKDDDYTKVLEGGGYAHGKLYFDKIKASYGVESISDKFRENDIYGNPFLFDYGEIKQINHNTMMYIYHTLDMKRLIGNFKPKTVVEIGGGYGGMAKVFSSLYPFEEYVLVDLPEVIALCKKYLGYFPELFKKVSFITCEELEKIDGIKNIDLSIAVFSLSECNEDIQNTYVGKIIENSKYSFIGYNRLHIPEVKEVYSKLVNRLNKNFDIFYDKSVVDCLYMYLTKREEK